jgi:23S rRNA (uracil1939-C5)-methyltransferase
MKDVPVSDYAAEGKALARVEGKVIFIEGAVPGDVVDVFITKNKKDWAEGRAKEIKQLSKERVEPFCIHFGVCGGCKWQMLPYKKQLEYKQHEATQQLQRIGKVDLPEITPIAGGGKTIHYRNKLEFTFSNKRFLHEDEIRKDQTILQENALGYHVPRIFDKVLDIYECWLMDPVNNTIRNTIRQIAVEKSYAFYDIKEHTGWLRNVVIRYCETGELMVNVIFAHDDEPERQYLLQRLLETIPAITTLLYTINPKWNDTIYDLQPVVYSGKGYVVEKLGEYQFIISPKSFFQTNSTQAKKLYDIAGEFAGLTGKEIVYDLYCGTGSIGIYLSNKAGKIIGVETVAEAVEDAKRNAELNNVTHAAFYAGDVIDVCTDDFFRQHGRPDVIITDPPRAGMHEKLVKKLLEIGAAKIVYVSCNVATQARDLALLHERYRVERVQPVDMFPHTHHIESVVLLTLRTQLKDGN